MEAEIQEVLECFDSISLKSLQSLVGANDINRVEASVVNLIVKGKLKQFRIDDGYVVKITREPVLANVLNKLKSIDLG